MGENFFIGTGTFSLGCINAALACYLAALRFIQYPYPILVNILFQSLHNEEMQYFSAAQHLNLYIYFAHQKKVKIWYFSYLISEIVSSPQNGTKTQYI